MSEYYIVESRDISIYIYNRIIEPRWYHILIVQASYFF